MKICRYLCRVSDKKTPERKISISSEEGELKTGEVLDDLMFTLILHGPNQNNYLDVKLWTGCVLSQCTYRYRFTWFCFETGSLSPGYTWSLCIPSVLCPLSSSLTRLYCNSQGRTCLSLDVRYQEENWYRTLSFFLFYPHTLFLRYWGWWKQLCISWDMIVKEHRRYGIS